MDISSSGPVAGQWWQRGVIYQIYPRSFQDSNADGIGDLEGIRQRLPYLKALGVDALWLSPIFASPMADFGYDVENYTAIAKIFGTMADFDRLIADVHGAGLKLILDFVPNHSSDRHPWFIDSRSSRASAKRDWYVWRDPGRDGGPPNNWVSEFGGSAWSFDAPSGQYYYHAYLAEQPDLNWRNPEVREAMLGVMRFWLDKGVDGFRVDAIHHLIEDETLRDNPLDELWREGMSPARRLIRRYTMDQAEVHEAIAAMRRTSDAYADRVLIGEAYLPIDRLMAYYGVDLGGFQMPFNFHLITAPWTPTSIAALVGAYERALPPGAWPNWVLGNHDRQRVASRLGPDQARVAAMMMLTLRGTPTIYQGEELGMLDVPIPADRVRDPWEKNVPGFGRDPVRTPMPWNQQTNRGFTEGAPWLPLGPVGRPADVETQSDDEMSMLSLYRALLGLRRDYPALSVGDFGLLQADEQVLAYERRHMQHKVVVALNMSARPAPIQLVGRVLLSTRRDKERGETTALTSLSAHQGVILRAEPD